MEKGRFFVWEILMLGVFLGGDLVGLAWY